MPEVGREEARAGGSAREGAARVTLGMTRGQSGALEMWVI